MTVRNGGCICDQIITLNSGRPSLQLVEGKGASPCTFVFSTRLLERFLTMSATCEPLLEALKDCLMRSDCVLKKGKLPSECLRQHTDELPDACKSLRHAVFECKRGLVSSLKFHRIRYGLLMETGVQVDMRKRFRGNQAAIMVGPGYKCPLSDAYPTLLTGQRIAREKKGRGWR